MMKEYQPFGINPDPIILPIDLTLLINKEEHVARYINPMYPSGVLLDDVRSHTVRCVRVARSLDLSLDTNRLQRMIWVHDIPEIITNDIVSPIKHGLSKEDKYERSMHEVNAARYLLSDKDFDLFVDMEKASDFMNAENDTQDFSQEALIAFVIDKIDGNMFFHFYISKWIREGRSSGNFFETNKNAMEYTFLQYEKFSDRLKLLGSKFEESEEMVCVLMEKQLQYIRGWWVGLEEQVPDNIREYLFVS